MPEVKFYKPETSLQWIVTQFETIKYESLNQILSDKFIPRPDVALVFHFGNIPKMIMPDDFLLQPYFVAPVVTVPKQLILEGKLDGFIVVCKSTVLSRIFKLDMSEKSNGIIELPSGIFAPLWKKLHDITSDQGRIECFTGFIRNLVPQDYEPDIIDVIYDDIIESNLKFSLKNIEENSFQSISSLQRNFNIRVGVSMKKLIRIARINYIFKNMLNDQNFNAQQLMFEGDYYDQSHFIKDFKELTGETPKQFFLHNTELCRIISGMFKGDFSVQKN